MFRGAPIAIGASTFKNARVLRDHMTPAESLLWEHLKVKKLGGHKFRCQHPISGYVLDFYCHRAKLAIELDGSIHDATPQQLYDQERTKDLNIEGINVFEVSQC